MVVVTYLKSFPDQPQALSKHQLRKHFVDCDADHDGFLTREEIKEAFRKLGAIIPAFRTWQGVRHADANKDGRVHGDELDELVEFVYKLQYTSTSNN